MTDRSPRVPAPTMLGVLRNREFRLLWIADGQSLVGDQVARVALAVLVFDRTSSALLTAAVYGLTFLPALFGSVLLGPLADRLPRRTLLVGGDLLRAALLAVMAIPAVPLPLVTTALVLATLVASPWFAAESALVLDVLGEEQYPAGLGLRTATEQAAQLLGFGVGGVAVALIGPHPALAVNAATFVISAALIRVGVRRRPAAVAREAGRRRWLHGAGSVLHDRRLVLLLALSWLLGLLIVPEGLAAPYVEQTVGGATAVGIFLAAMPGGMLVGSIVFTRLAPGLRARALGPLAVVAGLPLLGFAARPGLVVACVLLFVTGVCTTYQLQVVTEFMTTVSPAVRGQAAGVAAAGLLAAQGVGLLAGGGVAQWTTPATAIVVAGAAATLLGSVLALRRHRGVGGAILRIRRAPLHNVESYFQAQWRSITGLLSSRTDELSSTADHLDDLGAMA